MNERSTLETRVARLERANRRLLVAVGLLAVLPLLTLAACGERKSGGASESIRAGGFQMIDDTGAVRAEIRLDEQGPGIYLYDETGANRISLSHDDDQTALFLRDAVGDIRVGAAQFAHGGGGFALHGAEAKGGAVLYLAQRGSLSFYDAEGTVTHRVP